MKLSIPFVALALCLQACSNTAPSNAELIAGAGESRAYHNANNLPAHGVALEGYCPVAYFAVNRPVRGKKEHTSIYSGVTYRFVSADAKAAFDADPEHYVPAFGGWCAFGMSIEDKFPVDPTNFKIVDGRLMVFLKNAGIDARALWNKGDDTGQTAKASAHWKKVQG